MPECELARQPLARVLDVHDAAVLKRKADGSPAETDEDTLKLLEDGAKELRDDFDEADKS